MTGKKIKYFQISPWLKITQESPEVVILLHSKTNSSKHFYLMLFAIAMAGLFYAGFVDPNGGTRANMFLLFSPLVAGYGFLNILWAKFSKTEIRLGENIQRKFSCTPLFQLSRAWDWKKIENLRSTNWGDPEKNGIVFNSERKFCTLVKNLSDFEARQLLEMIEERMRLEQPT
ncbi:MAG: hypothetical protein ABJL55_18705 [Roseibium sp.]